MDQHNNCRETAMRRFVYFGLCLLLFSWSATRGWCETKYIRTIVSITLRTGPGTDHKIIRMIESGKEVDVLEAGEEWARVRIAGGQIGWVMTSLLTSEKPLLIVPATRVPSTEGNIDEERQEELLNENQALGAENQRLAAALAERQSKIDALEAAFDSPTRGSEGCADCDALKSENEKNAASLAEQTNKARALEDTIADLQFRHNIWWFVLGAGVLIVGFIIGLSAKRPRRRSLLM
jgi:SH3 domain protein